VSYPSRGGTLMTLGARAACQRSESRAIAARPSGEAPRHPQTDATAAARSPRNGWTDTRMRLAIICPQDRGALRALHRRHYQGRREAAPVQILVHRPPGETPGHPRDSPATRSWHNSLTCGWP
jgi:hypothetical protein